VRGKKEAPLGEGLRVLLHGGGTADSESSRVDYLQLVGTYLVSMVPAVPTTSDCAVAVVLSADAHAQSILPDVVPNTAPAMFGESVSKLVPVVN